MSNLIMEEWEKEWERAWKRENTDDKGELLNNFNIILKKARFDIINTDREAREEVEKEKFNFRAKKIPPSIAVARYMTTVSLVRFVEKEGGKFYEAIDPFNAPFKLRSQVMYERELKEILKAGFELNEARETANEFATHELNKPLVAAYGTEHEPAEAQRLADADTAKLYELVIHAREREKSSKERLLKRRGDWEEALEQEDVSRLDRILKETITEGKRETEKMWAMTDKEIFEHTKNEKKNIKGDNEEKGGKNWQRALKLPTFLSPF